MIKYSPSRDETIISCDLCPNEEPIQGKEYDWYTVETDKKKKHCCSTKCYNKWYVKLFGGFVERKNE